MVCRNETVDVWDTYQFDDPNDQFEREPFSILISSKDTETGLLFTLGAHAQVCLSVCVCVCRRLFWHYRLRGGPLAIPAASELREPEK